MPKLEIHPLSELRGEAAALLAERFERQRAAEPLLPDIDDFEPHVAGLDGLVATRGGTAVAYLAGAVEGDTAWTRFAGCAAKEAEAVRDLFAVMAERWQVSRFQVVVPGSDLELVDVFFHLAFGCQAFWAVRETEPAEPPGFGGRVRPGTSADHEAAASFDEDLMRLQAASPSFSGMSMPTRAESLEEWADTWGGQEAFVHFVAELDGAVAGHALLYRRPEGDLRVPEGNIDLAHAEVREELRGRGVGLALTAHVLGWAHDHGYRSITTDWRSVNLLSSRFWPRRGFRPQYLRLYRAVP
jgi:GNAT superfamily N-acetyltransferase